VEAAVTPALLADGLLALVIVAVAVRVLVIGDLFESVVLFIVFGVLMAVAWARLHAVDLALAEAAIGAGLTGALLLDTLADRHTPNPAGPATGDGPRRWTVPVAAGVALTVSAILLHVVGTLPTAFDGLAPLVEQAVPRSGASNPVTSVLLNFRAWDTLLEVVVLLAAVMGAWSLRGLPPGTLRLDASPGRVLSTLLRLVIPVIVVVAGYLLWAGTSAPGGAFQAGAVLGAAGVLLHASGVLPGVTLRVWPARLLLAGGLTVFLMVAMAMPAAGRLVLDYPEPWAGPLMLLVESALTVSIAATLIALFIGGEHGRRDAR
jgi:multisubunit Na+/H+ antiporter MnhB subunit